jgi:hypothetical protein
MDRSQQQLDVQLKGLEHALRIVKPLVQNAGIPEFVDDQVTHVTRETFQSKTFQGASFGFLDSKFGYGKGDRFLFTILMNDGRQIFIAAGKISSGNPYEVMHGSLMGGGDLRKQLCLGYVFDGDQKITEYKDGNKGDEYVGQYGKPEALLPHARESLGTSVASETVGR